MTQLHELLRGRSLLIFDFDGTLADSSPLHARAFAETLAPLGVEVDYPAIAGMATYDAVSACLRRAGHAASDSEIQALAAKKQSIGRALIAEELTPLPGAAEFLEWARERFRISLVSSGSRATIDLALARLGLDGWFDPLICADDLTRAKPDPEGFRLALECTRTSADAALVFEDSAAGFAAAAAAGIACWDARHDLWQALGVANR